MNDLEINGMDEVSHGTSYRSRILCKYYDAETPQPERAGEFQAYTGRGNQLCFDADQVDYNRS